MNDIDYAVHLLLKGIPVIIPTDTVYGLACINKDYAIQKLYSLKKRDKAKKIIALVSDVEYINELTDDIDYNLVNKFMPGQLSIVCKSKGKYIDLVGDTIGIRIPDCNIARDIIRKCGGILMVTSANISGYPASTTIDTISKELLDNIEFIVKSNKILSGTPSTIISYIDNKYTLIREGNIKFKEVIDFENNKSSKND